MSWLITNLTAAFLLPPLNLLLAALGGLLLWRKRPYVARTLLAIAATGLWLLSTPFVSESLIHQLENTADAIPDHIVPAGNSPQAIVVLGGGTYFNAPEYAADTVGDASLVRIRYAAQLYRRTQLPILITGGTPTGSAIAEAQLMKTVLNDELGTPVKWIEVQSGNTLENARHSQEILRESGITRIYLITHAWHMPRAQRAFEAAGFSVTPAPTAFTTRHRLDALAFLPDTSALHGSRIFMHELIGMLWYKLKS